MIWHENSECKALEGNDPVNRIAADIEILLSGTVLSHICVL